MKYIAWTKSEDNALKNAFEKYNADFKQGRHGSTISRIKADLNRRGIIRSEAGVHRRLQRLGLQFYTLKNGEIEGKCIDCKKVFFTQERLIKRAINKKVYCSKCAKIHKHDWNKEHREEVLQYYKDYNKAHSKKRIEQQRVRRAKKHG